MGRTIAVAVVCFALGGGSVYLLRGGVSDHEAAAVPAPPHDAAAPPAPASPGTAPLDDLIVPIDPELAKRAGIQTTAVGGGAIATTLRVPATVMPDQYRQVMVSSLVGGQVTQVTAQLGDRVHKGSPLARIFSSDLADAQMRYLSARAELAAADERLQRTTRLVAIGAASQQELEQTQAERTKVATNVEGDAARLRLFGMTPAAIGRLKTANDISATLTLTSPADGVVTERTANAGIAVMPSVPLFVVSSLSPVWVIAEVAERDISRVRIGAAAAVSLAGAATSTGKVTYIAPEVRAETRTAQVRVELPNPGGQFRFGMLVSVELPGLTKETTGTVTVPDAAVQSIGGRSFVYLARAGRPGEFIEREVTTGARSNGTVEILRGVAPGDTVVTGGSFFVRAERERLGLRQEAPAHDAHAGPVKMVQVDVTAAGFTPARVDVTAGTHVRLRVTRKVESTCGTDLVVAGKKITEHLPLNSPVEVDLGTVTRGEVAFSCGMNMLKGKIVVQAP